MPNYSLVVDATFQPFTYQELAAPIMQATEKHEQLLDKYDELTLTSQQYGRYVGGEGSKSKMMYDTYMNDLTNARDLLNQYGLSRSGRSMLSKVRGSYADNMMPLQDAYAMRKQEALEQQKALMADPTTRFSRDASTTDLDYYLDNPNGGYKPVSGKLVQTQVAAAMAAFSKRIMDPTSQEAKELANVAPEFYKAVQYGIPPEMAANWQNYPVLVGVMRNVLGANGISMDANGNFVGNQLFDATVANEIGSMAALGMYAGVGQTQLVEDVGGRAALNWQYTKMGKDLDFQHQSALNNQTFEHQKELKGMDLQAELQKELIKKGVGADGLPIGMSASGVVNESMVAMNGAPANTGAQKELGKLGKGLGLKYDEKNGFSNTGNATLLGINLYRKDGNLKTMSEFEADKKYTLNFNVKAKDLDKVRSLMSQKDYERAKNAVKGYNYGPEHELYVPLTGTYNQLKGFTGDNYRLEQARNHTIQPYKDYLKKLSTVDGYEMYETKDGTPYVKNSNNERPTIQGVTQRLNNSRRAYDPSYTQLVGLSVDPGKITSNISTNTRLLEVNGANASGKYTTKAGDFKKVGDIFKTHKDAEVTVSTTKGNEGLMIHYSGVDGKDHYYIVPVDAISEQSTRRNINGLSETMNAINDVKSKYGEETFNALADAQSTAGMTQDVINAMYYVKGLINDYATYRNNIVQDLERENTAEAYKVNKGISD